MRRWDLNTQLGIFVITSIMTWGGAIGSAQGPVVLFEGDQGVQVAQDVGVRVALDDGRFEIRMPARPMPAYFHNTASKIYFGSGTMVSMSTLRYSVKGQADAAKDGVDFLRRFCGGLMNSWGGEELSFTELADPDYPAVEQRFRHDVVGGVPPGYFTHRAYYVDGQICSVYFDVAKNKYESERDEIDAAREQYFDSLVIDRKRPPHPPFGHADRERAKWTTPVPGIRKRFAAAHGMLTERFAFCQTMDLDEFHWLVDELRPSGYRPTSFRPYIAKGNVHVAAVLIRDGQPFVIASGQLSNQIEARNRSAGQGFNQVDIGGWSRDDQFYYSAVWQLVLPKRGMNKPVVGIPDSQIEERTEKVRNESYEVSRRHRMLGTIGDEQAYRHSLIASKPRTGARFRHIQGDHSVYEQELSKKLVPYEIDLSLSKSGEIDYLASFSDAKTRYEQAHGQSVAEHLQSCQQFAKSGLNPVAISVRFREGKGYESASIWHDRLAEP